MCIMIILILVLSKDKNTYIMYVYYFHREVHRGDEYRDLHMHVVYNLLVSIYIYILQYSYVTY